MNRWHPFTEDYVKQWYELRLPDGTVIQHLWPNAGKMVATDGTGRMWLPGAGEVRRCTCGNEWGRCTVSTADNSDDAP